MNNKKMTLVTFYAGFDLVLGYGMLNGRVMYPADDDLGLKGVDGRGEFVGLLMNDI